MSSNKSPMNRKVLERYDIVLSEEVYSPRNSYVRVPGHVKIVIEALLEHEIQIPVSLRKLFEDEQRQQFPKVANVDERTALPPEAAFYPIVHDLSRPMRRDIVEIEDEIEQVAKLARIAGEYDAAKVSQETWEHFLRSYIFLGFEDSGLRTSRLDKLFDAWSLEYKICWSAVTKLSPVFEDPPQPSLTYGFPVHVSHKIPTGFNLNEGVTNFSLNTLVDLSPVVTCPNMRPSALRERMTVWQTSERDDLICFPWALVEVHSSPTDEPVEMCYCRAASSANAALDMQRQLRPVWAVAQDIPPIIFFTFSGPEVRVWVSFLDTKGSKTTTTCLCIWAGTLTATWCIVVLREIIRNMTFWASRILKPQISARISQLRPIATASAPSTHGTTLFTKTVVESPHILEDTSGPRSEKPNPSTKSSPSSQQKKFVFGSSLSAPSETIKQHTEENTSLKTQKSIFNVQSGLSSQQDFRSFNATISTEKPVSSGQSGLLFSDRKIISFDPKVETEKPHDKNIKILKAEKAESDVQHGTLFAEKSPSITKSSNIAVEGWKTKYISCKGKKVPIRIPSNDERKPWRWDPRYYSWFEPPRVMHFGKPFSLGTKDTGDSGDSVAQILGGLKNLQVENSNEEKEAGAVNGKLGLTEGTRDIAEGGVGAKKSPIVKAEIQGTRPGPSETSKDASSAKPNTGVDDSNEVDDESVGKYFVYRTNESFHARTYEPAIWDSDGETDQSYVSSDWRDGTDSESSDVYFDEDEADDEGSESASSSGYDDASVEELLSGLKIENDEVASTSTSFLGPPGQVRDLTLDDIDDLLYTAANVISGEAFIQLKTVGTLLENLKGMELLDATWRALENWEGPSPSLYSYRGEQLLATVRNLNDFTSSQNENLIHPFEPHHLTMALRKDDLDQTLQGMQRRGDWRLRDLLKVILQSWDGEKCMELLSNELLEITPEEFDNMLREAFDVVN